MADWTNQSNDSLLPGEPWTSAKALAAFENPVAITEGAPGAPRSVPASLAQGLIARTTGAAEVFHGVTDLITSNWLRMINLGGVVEIRFSSDNGANWTITQSPSDPNFAAYVNLHTGRVIWNDIDTVVSGAPFNAVQAYSVSTTSFALWEYAYRGDGL